MLDRLVVQVHLRQLQQQVCLTGFQPLEQVCRGPCSGSRSPPRAGSSPASGTGVSSFCSGSGFSPTSPTPWASGGVSTSAGAGVPGVPGPDDAWNCSPGGRCGSGQDFYLDLGVTSPSVPAWQTNYSSGQPGAVNTLTTDNGAPVIIIIIIITIIIISTCAPIGTGSGCGGGVPGR